MDIRGTNAETLHLVDHDRSLRQRFMDSPSAARADRLSLPK
jgi:hypothetical protein